jgi:hypothetical protein
VPFELGKRYVESDFGVQAQEILSDIRYRLVVREADWHVEGFGDDTIINGRPWQVVRASLESRGTPVR